MMRRKSGRTPSLLPNYVILILLLLFAAGPLVILGFNSLKTTAEIGANPLGPPSTFACKTLPMPGPRATMRPR